MTRILHQGLNKNAIARYYRTIPVLYCVCRIDWFTYVHHLQSTSQFSITEQEGGRFQFHIHYSIDSIER